MGGGMFDREFTKSLIFRDFDDALKQSSRYVYLVHILQTVMYFTDWCSWTGVLQTGL